MHPALPTFRTFNWTIESQYRPFILALRIYWPARVRIFA